jgi:Na+/melibiose symporter-like transporter
MNKPIHGNSVNRVILKPRFKEVLKASQETVINTLDRKLKSAACKFDSKIVGHHVVIDIPEKDNYFWSPQLHVEIEKETENTTVIKCLFGPKPQVWTFFMFIHFVVAATFFIFFVIAYSKYTLDKDYSFALTICVVMPILWIVLYIFGQLGKKKGYKQMLRIHYFLIDSLSELK